MDEETFQKSLRSFLKKVGITSQREIEQAVSQRAEDGRLADAQKIPASVVLRVPELDLEVTIDEELKLR